MPDFSYTASDLEGHIVTGVIEAKDADEAMRIIGQMGLLRPRLVAGRLSADEADDFATTVSDAVSSDMPLAAALEAAAMEIDRPKLRAALQRLGKVVQDGNSLDAALVRLDDLIPPETAALLSASSRSGAIAHVLPDIIEQRKAVRMIWLELVMLVSYPLVVLYAAMLLFKPNWVLAMLGILGAGCVYLFAVQEEALLIEKFGESYRRYMQAVPRFNLLAGSLRLLLARLAEKRGVP